MSFLDVVAQYVAAYKAIANYTSGIENAGAPPDGSFYPHWQNAQAALLQGKQAALGWVNGVAVRAKDVPAGITNWNPEMAAVIADLKLHAKPPLTEADKRAIAADANQIVQILGRQTGQFSALATGLSSLAADLSKASSDINNCRHAVDNDIRGYREALWQLEGMLYAEQRKPCPNRERIAELERQIREQRRYEFAANGWYSVLTNVSDFAKEAVPSARFLQGFWQEICKGVEQTINTAQKLPQDPEAALALDIEHIEKAWTGLQQEMQKIAEQLP